MITGQQVYQELMDLDLDLQDIGKMMPLRMFLDTVPPGASGLIAFHDAITKFHGQILALVKEGQKLVPGGFEL